MQFFSWTFIKGRLKAIVSMMKDKTVPTRKKVLVIFGLIYLVLPVDLIPPVLFPFGFLDDLVLWIWIIWHLKDTLDQYWLGEKTVDYSKDFKHKNIIEKSISVSFMMFFIMSAIHITAPLSVPTR